MPTQDTGNARADLRDQFERLAAFYASDDGIIAAQLIAAAVTHVDGPAMVRDRFFGRRRSDTEALVEQGKRAGQVRTDLETGLIVDLLFGPIIFRLFNGRGPLDRGEARTVANVAVAAISGPQ